MGCTRINKVSKRGWPSVDGLGIGRNEAIAVLF